MAYIENPFKEGGFALCISDNFPVVATTNENKSEIGTHPTNHPKKGKVYLVDEILGEFLRFNQFDCDDENHPDYGFKWWKHTQFRPLTEQEEEQHCEEIAINFKEWWDKNLLNIPEKHSLNG